MPGEPRAQDDGLILLAQVDRVGRDRHHFPAADALAAPRHHRFGIPLRLEDGDPGTDPLGAAGLPGQIDTHFWQRFGGAIMLSLLGDLGQAAVNAAQTSANTNITLGNTQSTTQELANTALQNSINIPPTLYRNQGDRVNIFVARDLDFSSVYSIQ